jgi:DNA invertase Pin-like site-specific DNA recombinase/integrase
MRAAIYARYSSDLQSDASIDDQVRICKALVAREGWSLASTYADHAISGSIRSRPGYQTLLEDARRGEFQVVVAEALDRLSRDQEDIAALYKHLAFAGAKLVTIAEGEINELHVGFKGTMNALFLKDLAQKIRRGQEGCVRGGRSGGGLGYAYKVIRDFDMRGEPIRGNLAIDDAKAAVVRRIFEEYGRGRSPRAIATVLNKEDIPGPSGKPWCASTINGNWRRGTGILNNELYVGRRVWNRQRFVKDPTTGKRVTRYNPTEQLIVQDAPDLRIISDELWKRAKARQRDVRRTVTGVNGNIRSERARRPAYLFSGLLRCGVCGGGFSKRSETQYACSTAHERGTCSNRLRIRRDVLEASVLSGLKLHLMKPELVREFIAEYHRELKRLNASFDLERSQRKAELIQVEREISGIIEAIKGGLRTPSLQAELLRLEARKQELGESITDSQPALLRVHSNLAELYRQKVARLQDELNAEDVRTEAAAALRSLIREIRLIPEDGQLEIELVGNLTAILALGGNDRPKKGARGPKITVVAGEGLEPRPWDPCPGSPQLNRSQHIPVVGRCQCADFACNPLYIWLHSSAWGHTPNLAYFVSPACPRVPGDTNGWTTGSTGYGMRKQLTEAMIEKLRAPETGRLEIFDSIVPAMALRVTSNGAKSFVVRTRIKGWPVPIRFTIGDAAMNLSDARQQASDVLRECRAGNDPREARKAKAEEAKRQRKNTFEAVAEEFITEHVAKLRDKDHTEAEIRRHLVAHWGKRPIAAITEDDATERVRQIKKENGPHVARRVLAYMKMLFAWAAGPTRPRAERLKVNPCAELRPKHFGLKLTPRQVALSDDHVRLIWAAAGKLAEPFGPFFKMLLLSGQRRGEVAEMTWGELDLDRERVWVVPAERMKAKRAHLVPLTERMIALLKELQASRGSGDYVFSTTLGKRPISGFSKAKLALDAKVAELRAEELAQAGQSGGGAEVRDLPEWRIHDLRRVVRTGLGALPSVPRDIRELVIAHVPPALVTTYDLWPYRAEKLEALRLWGERLISIVEPQSQQAAAE